MKDKISVLMDGELDERAAGEAISTLARDAEALQTWRTYHLISDALRERRVLSRGFTARLAARLAAEPTVLSPGRVKSEPHKWFAVSAAAASVAAVALVGWLAYGPHPQVAPPPAPVAQAQPAQTKPALVPPPTAANDYLLAHQGFSPRLSLLGMAPYVRTVSEREQETRK